MELEYLKNNIFNLILIFFLLNQKNKIKNKIKQNKIK